MQLTPQESSAAFWSGAKKGVIRSFGYIALFGLPILALMMLNVIPAVSVTVGIISVLSTALSVGMFSGHNAVAQYHQQKHNQMYEAKLAELEGLTQTIQSAPEEHLQHSPKISTIIQEGSRTGSSFAATTQEERQLKSSSPRTLH